MSGFTSPNHTQTPNDLFDIHMKDMTEVELKVTLAVVRKTLGYHKKQDPISLTQLEEMTGLSRRACIEGADYAIKRGLIEVVGKGKRGIHIYGLVINSNQSQESTSDNLSPEDTTTSDNLLPVTSDNLLPTKESIKETKEKKDTSSDEDVTVSHSDTSTTTDYQHYFGAIAKGAFEISDLKGISPNSRKRIGALAKIAQQLIAARQPGISAEQGAALITKFCAAETFKSNLQGAPKFELNFAAWLEKNAQHIPGYLRSLDSAPKIIPDDDMEYVDPEEVKRVLAETMAALKANAAAKNKPEAVA